MVSRLDYFAASPLASKVMLALEAMTSNLSVDERLVHLIKIRASQLNGCAFCTDMHSIDLRRIGESNRRLYSIPVWRNSSFFTARERAALAWTEAVIPMTGGEISDEIYDQLRAVFTDEEMVDLTMAINVICSWNRLAVSFRQKPFS